MQDLIKAEVNVKDIEYITDTSGFIKKKVKPNYKTLGRRLGKNMKAAAQIIQELGQDDIADAYYPFGRNNMLEVAFLASHLLWMTSRDEMEILYDMVTTEAAKAMGIPNFKIEKGAPANLVVLDVPDVREALRYHRAPVHVISRGKLIAN